MTAIPDDLLHLLAEEAIEAQQWAMRHGFKRAQQIERVAKVLAKRLTNTPDPLLQEATAGVSADQAPMRTAQNDVGILFPVGQGGHAAGHRSVKSEHQDAASQWVGNQPEVGGTAAAKNFEIGPGVADPAQAAVRLDLARAM